eukprot:gene15077-biopygen1067
MHAMGYCHRDIKPENCMVERDTQRLKLIDFGLSKHLESVVTLGVGTPDYMPPEMVRSQIRQQQQHKQQQQRPPFVDTSAAAGNTNGGLQQQQQQPPYDAKAVDAWAMGVLMYLLVTGTYPFEDPAQPNNLAATIMNIQAGRRRPLPDTISGGCHNIIAGLLNADPEQRTRLEDLAFDTWLLQSAAAHAARLGHPLCDCFDAGNPAWIMPTNYAEPPFAARAADAVTTPARTAPAAAAVMMTTTAAASAPAGNPAYHLHSTPHTAAAAASVWNGRSELCNPPSSGIPGQGGQAAYDMQNHHHHHHQQGQQQQHHHHHHNQHAYSQAAAPAVAHLSSLDGHEMSLEDDMEVEDGVPRQQPASPEPPGPPAAGQSTGQQQEPNTGGAAAVGGAAAAAAAAAAHAGSLGHSGSIKRGLTWLVPPFMRRCMPDAMM